MLHRLTSENLLGLDDISKLELGRNRAGSVDSTLEFEVLPEAKRMVGRIGFALACSVTEKYGTAFWLDAGRADVRDCGCDFEFGDSVETELIDDIKWNFLFAIEGIKSPISYLSSVLSLIQVFRFSVDPPGRGLPGVDLDWVFARWQDYQSPWCKYEVGYFLQHATDEDARPHGFDLWMTDRWNRWKQ